jgi:hypothetical protein
MKLKQLDGRSKANAKFKELQIEMNKPETLENLSPTLWELFHDHLEEDLQFLKRTNDYKRTIANAKG